MTVLEILKQAVPCNCGKSKLIVNKEGEEIQIMCWSCDKKGPFGKTTEEIVERWNSQKKSSLKEIYQRFKMTEISV